MKLRANLRVPQQKAALNMILDDEQIKTYQALYQERFGKEISKQDAYASAIKLLRLLELTYGAMTEGELAQIQERRQKMLEPLKKRINGP